MGLTFCFLVLQRVHAVLARFRGLYSWDGVESLEGPVNSFRSMTWKYT